jgi:catechol 2,3-dioxygenase-like lactoylglutathione lyase family enzyme
MVPPSTLTALPALRQKGNGEGRPFPTRSRCRRTPPRRNQNHHENHAHQQPRNHANEAHAEWRLTPHHQIESTRRQGWFQFALAVPDIAGTFAAVVAAGAEPSLAPTTAPDGVSLVAFVRDPDGNLVEFLQRPARPGPPG